MRRFVRVLTSLVAAAPLIAGTSFAQAAGSNRAQTSANQAMLAPQPRAQCELSSPPVDIGQNDARVVMLDYERQCYRQLAEIERAKLEELQATVRAKDKAVSSNHRGGYKRLVRHPVRRDLQLAGK
ncbi:MAG: hypothetical protein QOK01_284 [Alphaproteobacteria bacterium]|nr:hypothetical protein [Alphaproteobacteria bacterium]